MDFVHLTTDDFNTKHADAMATVRIDEKAVDLIHIGCTKVKDIQIETSASVFLLWKNEIGAIAKKTEAFIQRFLPGKKVSPSELDLFQCEVTWDGDNPFGVLYRYRITGEYDGPQYDLTQFDQQSVVEADFSIEGSKFNTAGMTLTSNNVYE